MGSGNVPGNRPRRIVLAAPPINTYRATFAELESHIPHSQVSSHRPNPYDTPCRLLFLILSHRPVPIQLASTASSRFLNPRVKLCHEVRIDSHSLRLVLTQPGWAICLRKPTPSPTNAPLTLSTRAMIRHYLPTPLLLLALLPLAPWAAAITCTTNFGNSSSSGDSCLCPPGFNPKGGAGDCSVPVCGGGLYSPGSPAPLGGTGYGNVSSGSCGCSDGWTGPGCTGEYRTAALRSREKGAAHR